MTLNLSRHPSKKWGVLKAAAALLLLIILGVPATFVRAADFSGTSFEPFQVIIDRNIFSPTRHRIESEGPVGLEALSPEQMEGDHIFLVGALIYEGTAVAFFEGTGSDSSAVLPRGGTIAGYRLIEIRSDSVKLEKDDEQIDLSVGSALREVRDGRWEVVTDSPGPDRLGSRPEARDRDETGWDSAPSPETGGGGDSSNDDLLKKLMERRKQELGQ